MARRSRKRASNEQLDGSPNHQEAQEQPTVVNAEKPRLLCPETESTLPKEPEIKMAEEKEIKKVEGEGRNVPNQFRNEPDSTPAKEMITKSVNDLDSKHCELFPKLDSLSPIDSNSVLLPETEPVVVKNDANGLSTEPDSTTPRKKKKRKGKSLAKSGGEETHDAQSEPRESIPNLDPLSPKESDPVLPPESQPVAEKNGANQLCAEPESATPRKKRKRKDKSLSMSEGIETNDVHSEHRELIPDLDPLPLKDSNSVLLPGPGSFAEKKNTNQLCTEPESATPRKKKRKGKRKSLSNSEGVDVDHVNSERCELCPDLAALPPKDTEPLLLPEPAPVRGKNEANQLCTKPDSTFPKFKAAEIKDMDSGPVPPKDSNIVLLPEPESFAGKSDTNQLCTEPESVTPRKKKRKGKRKSLSNSEGVDVDHVNSERCELCPDLAALPPKDTDPLLLPEPAPVRGKNEANQLCTKPDSTFPKFKAAEIKDMDSGPVPPKDSNIVLLPEPESFAGKSDTNQLCTEPESVTPRKKKRKGKRKSLSNSEGVDVDHVNSERCELCPDLAALPPKDTDPLLLPEPAPVREKNEANQLCTKPDSTFPKFKAAEIKDMDSGPVPPKDSNIVLLPEPESFAEKSDTNQLCTEPESVTPRKKKKKGKRKSLSNSEGVEVNHVNSEDCELCPNLAALPSKDPDPILLLEPAPVREKNEANQLCTKPDSTSPKFKGAEIKDMDSGPVPPKDSNIVLLPEPESFAGKSDTNQLCTEPEAVTPRKKKRKGKRKSLSNSEGVEVNHVNSEDFELCPNLAALPPKDPDLIMLLEPAPVREKNEANQLFPKPDSTSPKFEGAEIKDMDSGSVPPKDSNFVLLPESESFAGQKNTNQLCTELESVTPRNKKRKGKRKSLSNSEGVKVNHVDSKHRELCPNLAVLSPKDPDPLLLPEPAPVGEKHEGNKLCTKPDSTSPKFEGAEIKEMDSENLELCPKLDPLPHKDSDLLLLPESEPAPPKGVDQEKKRKNKKKNKGKLKSEGVESNRPNDEHSQQCHKAKPTTPKEQNQRKRNRQAMNETHDSSIWSMVTPNYDFGPRGASIFNSEVARRGPWIPKMPLKDYERYERCLECGQICQSDQTCRGLRRLPYRSTQICFFCGTPGHSIGWCPMSPGAKCSEGIIMLDDYVRNKCSKESESAQQKVAPANVPTYAPIYTSFWPSNIHPYPRPFVRPTYAPFEVWRN